MMNSDNLRDIFGPFYEKSAEEKLAEQAQAIRDRKREAAK